MFLLTEDHLRLSNRLGRLDCCQTQPGRRVSDVVPQYDKVTRSMLDLLAGASVLTTAEFQRFNDEILDIEAAKMG